MFYFIVFVNIILLYDLINFDDYFVNMVHIQLYILHSVNTAIADRYFFRT